MGFWWDNIYVNIFSYGDPHFLIERSNNTIPYDVRFVFMDGQKLSRNTRLDNS